MTAANFLFSVLFNVASTMCACLSVCVCVCFCLDNVCALYIGRHELGLLSLDILSGM
jgi:hypothetical protein